MNTVINRDYSGGYRLFPSFFFGSMPSLGRILPWLGMARGGRECHCAIVLTGEGHFICPIRHEYESSRPSPGLYNIIYRSNYEESLECCFVLQIILSLQSQGFVLNSCPPRSILLIDVRIRTHYDREAHQGISALVTILLWQSQISQTP